MKGIGFVLGIFLLITVLVVALSGVGGLLKDGEDSWEEFHEKITFNLYDISRGDNADPTISNAFLTIAPLVENQWEGTQVAGLLNKVPENATIVVYGDVNGTGRCSFRIFETGESISGLSQSSWKAAIIKGGNADERRALLPKVATC